LASFSDISTGSDWREHQVWVLAVQDVDDVSTGSGSAVEESWYQAKKLDQSSGIITQRSQGIR
jgi:hypothetical protein